MKVSPSILIAVLSISCSAAFVPQQVKNVDTALFAGFGAKGSKKNSSAPKMTPLKPKQQWDRFGDFAKTSTRCEVGVKVVKGDDSGEWLKVGYVNVKDDAEDVTLAVARQRSLIAEHAKRLHPLSILPKDKIEWGLVDTNGEWQVVASMNDFPKNFEKIVGFEGIGDPASGYYCHYKDGKVVALNTGDA